MSQRQLMRLLQDAKRREWNFFVDLFNRITDKWRKEIASGRNDERV